MSVDNRRLGLKLKGVATPKLAPPPPVAPETWRALVATAADFAALKPWEFTYDTDVVGLVDPGTGETRIAAVLGRRREVFAAVIYRRTAGLRWILHMLSAPPDRPAFGDIEGVDCLKLEFVCKRELRKPDLAILNAAGFNPRGKGCVWPQFRSLEPGWHPWFINQVEADQLLVDLPRLTAFCRLLAQNSDLFAGRGATEIPFLPAILPDRPLTPADLNWRPLLPPPETGFEPFRPPADQLEKLRALSRRPGLECEYDCALTPGVSFCEQGRPCFGRVGLLVETGRGLVMGVAVESGTRAPGEAAGRALVTTLLRAGALPERLFIRSARLQRVVEPLCKELQIQLCPAMALPFLDEALAFLTDHLKAVNRS